MQKNKTLEKTKKVLEIILTTLGVTTLLIWVIIFVTLLLGLWYIP